MAKKVKFAKQYDHRWPSRAVTKFPAGYEGTVKDEVAAGAVAAGALTGDPSDAPSGKTATTTAVTGTEPAKK